ncbi:hypothetical protein K440DRAFT_313126 [Wilcoxina mikolae CBS 423.85]|nr:hypothetical protein K440DRAFT_313126 [Wilcoxina mikolae CBS 423.85]
MTRPKSGFSECSVCLDSMMPDAFPDKITDSCTHLTNTCTSCLSAMIANTLGGKEWLDPECPECKAKLSIYDVKKFGTPTQVETFDKRQTMKYLQSLAEYRSCLGPDCPNGQLHEGGEESPIVCCWLCGFKQCFTHHMPWDEHSGKTCDEVEADIQKRIKVEGITKSEELIRRTSKICPGCKFDIEKTGGCEHMTCQKCRYQFCFVCLASWTEIKEHDNSRHAKTCTFYAPPGRE